MFIVCSGYIFIQLLVGELELVCLPTSQPLSDLVFEPGLNGHSVVRIHYKRCTEHNCCGRDSEIVLTNVTFPYVSLLCSDVL